jgi:outer membrane protein OmpA-like peptidoglycan-associated protein
MKIRLLPLLGLSVWLLPVPALAQTPSRENELDAVITAMENNQSVNDRKVSLRNLQFETGTDRLTPGDQRYLDSLALALARIPTVTLEIGGHTDNTGSARRNNLLSQNRANRVRAYLTGRGVVARRIRAVGYGSAQPLATNDTPEGRAANRRVELSFQGLTSDVYTIVTKSGRKIPVTYLVVGKDGQTLSYRENASSPLTRLPAGTVDYVLMPDGSRLTMNRFAGGPAPATEAPPTPAPDPREPIEIKPSPRRGLGVWLDNRFPKINRVSVLLNAGVLPLAVEPTRINFAYVDESPSRDNLQSVIDLERSSLAGLGQIGLEVETDRGLILRSQFQLGIGSQAGASSFLLGAGKAFGKGKVRFVPSLDLTLGRSYLKLGDLEQNDVYIRVNGRDFYSQRVSIQFRNYFAAFTPQVALDVALSENLGLRLTGGYAYGFHTRSDLRFRGKNADSKALKAFEKLSAENVSFRLDGVRQTDARLFKVRGVYATVGLSYHLFHR